MTRKPALETSRPRNRRLGMLMLLTGAATAAAVLAPAASAEHGVIRRDHRLNSLARQMVIDGQEALQTSRRMARYSDYLEQDALEDLAEVVRSAGVLQSELMRSATGVGFRVRQANRILYSDFLESQRSARHLTAYNYVFHLLDRMEMTMRELNRAIGLDRGGVDGERARLMAHQLENAVVRTLQNARYEARYGRHGQSQAVDVLTRLERVATRFHNLLEQHRSDRFQTERVFRRLTNVHNQAQGIVPYAGFSYVVSQDFARVTRLVRQLESLYSTPVVVRPRPRPRPVPPVVRPGPRPRPRPVRVVH